MIEVSTINSFWYDGNTPIADLKDGRSVVLSEEDAQCVFDWFAMMADLPY
jgi:hypothetical protein